MRISDWSSDVCSSDLEHSQQHQTESVALPNDETSLAEPSDIRPISIVDEMKTSYLDYALSVIVARALPDVHDGLKPVHRRIPYACQEAGPVAGKPYRQSSRNVGPAMGKYNPPGHSGNHEDCKTAQQGN